MLPPKVPTEHARARAPGARAKEIQVSIFDDESATFNVLVNHEEQYSIWPADRVIPNGWRAVGKTGTKQECLAHIEQVWTDMRPLSLRKQMETSNERSS
jgi:MbtH protein